MMQQRNLSENNGSAPVPKRKVGTKVAPAADVDILRPSETINNQTLPPLSAPPPHNRVHLHNLMKIQNINVTNKSRPRVEEITKCQTKCFFVLLGVGFMSFGIGLTIYGNDAQLRDFLILGPGALIIGFILVVIGFMLICKDVFILHNSGQDTSDVKENGRRFTCYNMPSQDGAGIALANNQRIDPYTVTSSRRGTSCSSVQSEGVLTTSELLVENSSHDPVVAGHHSDRLAHQVSS